MENENIYPNDGQYYAPQAPLSQQRSQSQKRTDTLAQLPLIKEILQHIEDRIAATDSVKQALVVAETYKVTKDEALIALDLVRQQLETERSYLKGRIDSV
jgi:hypothetical protein